MKPASRNGSPGTRPVPGATLREALEEIEAGAAARDETPGFPSEAFALLAEAGALALPAPEVVAGTGRRSTFAHEWDTVRAVTRADGSVGRIYDGHLNGVERVSVAAPEPLRSRELAAVAAGELLLGVWGADPAPGEGKPARLTGDGTAVEGVKTFCSGAGGVHRALVLVRGPDDAPGPPHLAYVDLSGAPKRHEVDRSWYRGAGMRSSESHRVVFDGAPVLAVLGGPGEISREPYFGRDAVRTAASWSGIADRAVDSALGTLASKTDASDAEPDDIVSLAAGRMLAAQGTIDHWLEHAARTADGDPEAPFAALSIRLRSQVADACREILDEAARACGSRPFAIAGPLDRARRDLELFLLQHRLDPLLARAGRQAILDAGER